jgi:hypothetical protein
MRRRDNVEIRAQADFLSGVAFAARLMGTPSPQLESCVATLDNAARQTCGKGYMGCYGGQDCGSDHK